MSSELNKPIVSVIIPAYNCKEYLLVAVASVLKQNYSSVEIIIIDDGSTDGSLDLIRKKRREIPNIKIISQNNFGPSAARNVGIERCKGKYVAFLDADDQWLPNKLKKQVDFHKENPSVVMSFCQSVHCKNINNISFNKNLKPVLESRLSTSHDGFNLMPEDAASILFAYRIINTSSVMARRDVLLKVGSFDIALGGGEDWDLWIKLALTGPVAFTNELLTISVDRRGSTSHNNDLMLQCSYIVYERYISQILKINKRDVRIAKARLLKYKAFAKREDDKYYSSILYFLCAFYFAKEKKYLKAAARDLLVALRLFNDVC